jgi:hypothetical protein
MSKKNQKKLADEYVGTLADSIIKFAQWSKESDMDLQQKFAVAVVDKAKENKASKPTSQMMKAVLQEFKNRRSDKSK